MTLISGRSQWLAVTGVACYVLLRSVSAFPAGDEGLNRGSAVSDTIVGDPRVGKQLAPNFFDPAVAQQMSASITSCSSSNIAPALNQIGDALLGKPVSTTTGADCGDESAPEVGSCESFKSGSQYDPARVEDLRRKFDGALSALSCKKGKLDGAQSQISCLMNQSSALQAQIQALNKDFSENIQRAQRDVATINSVLKEREAQLEETNKHLQGDPESGRKGLLQLKQETEKLVNEQMPQQIQAAREKYKDIENARKGLEEQIVNRRMQLTNDCFSERSSPSFKCTPNGAPVSIREYILCRFEQNQQLGEKGQIERNQILADQAASRKRALESVLNGILGDSAGTLKIDPQKDPAGANAAMSKPVTITSIQDVETQYGNSLRKFNGKGLDIHGFVMGQMRSCFQRADKVIGRERKLASSAIGVADFTLKKQEREANEFANTLVEGYSQQWRENLAGLTGQNLPLNTQACNGGNPGVKVACLEDIRKNMTGLLNGNTPNSTMNLMIIGTRAGNTTGTASDPSSIINLKCQGLAGCVTALQNVSTNLNREKKRVADFKKDYVLKAKQSVDKFAKQMAAIMSPQSAKLEAQLQQLNASLASVGASPIHLKSLASEELELDEDGLPKPPKNVLAYVGSQVNPPLKDMGDGALSEGMANIAQVNKQLERKRERLAESRNRLETQVAGCQQQSFASLLQKLKTEADKVADCKGRDFCRRYAEGGELQRLISSVQDATSGLSESFTSTNDIDVTLNAGYENCEARASAEEILNRSKAAYDAAKIAFDGTREDDPLKTSKKTNLDTAKSEYEAIQKEFRDFDKTNVKCSAISQQINPILDEIQGAKRAMGAGSADAAR